MNQKTSEGLPNRWLLAGGGVLMQLALGAVYAWSVFRNPLIKTFGWSIADVTTTFSIAILVLGFAAFLGGLWMRRVGPRVVGITAGICYGLGVALASLSNGNIWVLWLTYGVLGGLGLGLGYIVPLATLVKWFPDRRGFITGLAVAGYGGGFGTMPAFAADYFGTKWVGSIYGLMLTAWGFAGVFGPLLIANIRQATGSFSGALITIACILLVASLLPVVLGRQAAAKAVSHAKPVGRV
jgi:MFS family permease